MGVGGWVNGWVYGCVGEWMGGWETHTNLQALVQRGLFKGRIAGFEERKQKHAIILETSVVQMFVKLQHKQTQSKTIILMTGWK